MFGKDSSQLGGYSNVNNAGSSYLRNTVRSTVYSGNPVIEEKLVTYQIYWKYYNNKHWASNNDELLSFNYLRAVIDKVNNFIVGKEGFEVSISDSYGDTIDAETVEKPYEALLRYNWKKNKKKLFLQKLFQTGGVCGDAYVFLYPDMKKGFVEYTLMDSRTCIPIFSNGDYTNVIGYNVIKLLGRRDDGYIQFVTEYRLNMVRTYYIKETGQNPDKFEQVETPNDYGFIPVVHIENIAMADTYGGKSDMEDILKINKVFNEMAEDLKMTIDYYAQPTTIITGGTVGQLKRGINQIWSGLPADASVFNLSLNEDMSATMSFLTMLKNAIHDLSGVPEEILSKVQHISNTSASALQMLFQPLIQVADKKSVSYGEGIDALNKMTCIMYAKSIGTHPLFARLPVEALSKPEAFFERYVSEVAWKYNLPNDRMGMLNEANIELTQGIGSRREWMDKLGKANIPSILEEIKADDERKAEMVQAERPAVAGAG